MSYQKESFSFGKAIFTCVLIAIVGYFVLAQVGAWDWATNQVNTGAAGAAYRGMSK